MHLFNCPSQIPVLAGPDQDKRSESEPCSQPPDTWPLIPELWRSTCIISCRGGSWQRPRQDILFELEVVSESPCHSRVCLCAVADVNWLWANLWLCSSQWGPNTTDEHELWSHPAVWCVCGHSGGFYRCSWWDPVRNIIMIKKNSLNKVIGFCAVPGSGYKESTCLWSMIRWSSAAIIWECQYENYWQTMAKKTNNLQNRKSCGEDYKHKLQLARQHSFNKYNSNIQCVYLVELNPSVEWGKPSFPLFPKGDTRFGIWNEGLMQWFIKIWILDLGCDCEFLSLCFRQ